MLAVFVSLKISRVCVCVCVCVCQWVCVCRWWEILDKTNMLPHLPPSPLESRLVQIYGQFLPMEYQLCLYKHIWVFSYINLCRTNGSVYIKMHWTEDNIKVLEIKKMQSRVYLYEHSSFVVVAKVRSSNKRTVSRDRFKKIWQKFAELGLTKGLSWFLNLAFNFIFLLLILSFKCYCVVQSESIEWCVEDQAFLRSYD